MTAPHQTGRDLVSRLRPPDRRLLLGYGPAVVIAAAFLLMALMVPTVAPEQNVSSVGVGSGGGSSTQGLGPATGLPVSGNATTPAAAGAVAGSGGVSASGSRTGAVGSSSGGSGAKAGGGGGGGTGASTGPVQAPGVVAACSGPQVAGDPYSPRCVRFSGSNGGATSRGVTASHITISYRIPADNITSVDAAIQEIAGKYNASEFTDTPASIYRTLGDLITYFNDHFQFYGRKLVLQSFHGQGQLTEEVTDGGQAQADADALTAADSIKAFADISALSQPYAQALSAQKVVNIGAPYMSQQWFESQAPYSWSFFPNCTDLGNEGAAVAVREIAGQNVSFAGTGVANGRPRKIAVLAPDNPVYQQCAAQVTSALAKAGHPVAANLSYTLDLSQLSQEAGSLEQQIVNDGITTVFCGCDPITLVYLTGDLYNAHYEPEWANIGAAFTDEDLVAQLFDQNVWAHAAGQTNNGTVPPYGSSLGYFAAKSVDPDNPPAHIVDLLYEDLYMLAIGIQGAGPDLTPQTFEQGMFNYSGGDGEYGPWSFDVGGTGEFTPQHQFRFEWWDPNATSAFDGEKGSWVVGSTWYTSSDVPTGTPPVFPNGPQ
jgi:hypothetical protein